MPTFTFEGFDIAYEIRRARGPRARGPKRPLVLVHALLLSRKHHRPLADELARRGNHVVLIDLLGHGDSSRPADVRHYSVPSAAQQVIALLDHLDVSETVLGGTSVGANVVLEAATRLGSRARALLLDMPALEDTSTSLGLVLSPLALLLTRGRPLADAATRALTGLPSPAPYGEVLADALSQDPESASAIIKGTLSGPLAPHPTQREKLDCPTLIVANMRDPLHRFSDAEELHLELVGSELVRSQSLLDLRWPPNVTSERVADWLDEVWG